MYRSMKCGSPAYDCFLLAWMSSVPDRRGRARLWQVGNKVMTSLLLFVWPMVAMAQEFALPQPGPEHEKLKERTGTWNVRSEEGEVPLKGTMTWKMGLNGLWLIGEFEGEFGANEKVKFSGRSFDTYDPVKKKYISVWIDSMTTAPTIMEGNYDTAGKILRMEGEGPGPDGRPVRYRISEEKKDDRTYIHKMYVRTPDGTEEEVFTLIYERR